MYKVIFAKPAEKALERLSREDRNRVLAKIKLLSFPFPPNFDAKKLTGYFGFYRLRVGKARIIFEIDQDKKEIWIRKIGYRGGVYN